MGILRARQAAQGKIGLVDATAASAIRLKLQKSGLKPTRPRLALSHLLFSSGDRHVTAETLYEEARRNGVHISLATVYNTLHQFEMANLVRQVAIFGGRIWYDTTTGPHCHYYREDTREVFDIPADATPVAPLLTAPEGMEIVGVDLVVRIRRKQEP